MSAGINLSLACAVSCGRPRERERLLRAIYYEFGEGRMLHIAKLAGFHRNEALNMAGVKRERPLSRREITSLMQPNF